MVSNPKPKKARTAKPAMDPGSREKQLISLAVDLAEQQLRDGTAPPSVINHYLKLSSTREEIEREMLKNQSTLTAAKAAAITQGQESETKVQEAIDAMKAYSGSNE